MRGWVLGDVPQADAISPRFLEGLPQAPEDVRVVLEKFIVFSALCFCFSCCLLLL